MPTPFHTGYFQVNWMTQGIYDAVKDNISPYQLYLMMDTNNAYLGRTRLFDMFHIVDSFDEPYRGDAKPKSLCVKLTQGEDGAPLIEAKILQENYTFTELVPPVMGEIVDEDLPEDRTVPTRRAVWKFVDDRLIALQEYFDALENHVRTMMNRAESAAVNAEASAIYADNSATEAESYAHGGTGSREGENKDNAKYYMNQAKEAAEEGGGSSEEARRYAEAAHVSAVAAGISENNAAASAIEAEQSATSALNSETATAASAQAAAVSETNAASSEANAEASAIAAGESERAAAGSQTAAANSASAAATSETNAAASAQAAAVSETNADASDTSAQLAAQAAEYARNGAVDAKVLAETAQSAAESAATDAADETADAIEDQFRDDLSALSAAVNSAQSAATVATNSQQSASASATSAQQSAAEAYEYAQQAGLNTVLILDAPPTVNTVAAVGKTAVWHDSSATDQSKADHEYHLLYIVESAGGKEYIWREDVTANQGNVAGGYPILGADGKLNANQLPVIHGNSAPTTSTAGVIAQTYSDDAAGKTYTCVSIGGTQEAPEYNWKENIYTDKNGTIAINFLPIATGNTKAKRGIIWASGSGLSIGGDGQILTNKASNNTIDGKTNSYYVIVPSNIDYAVRSVIPLVTEIPAATSDYSLVDSSATTNNHSMTYRHEPQTPSVYHLPAVEANSTVLHEIVLSIKFSSAVLTYEFQDSAGNTLAPLPLNGDIEAGSVVTFYCRYEPLLGQWVIMPVMVGKEAHA